LALSGIGWLVAPLPVHAAGNLDPEKELRPWQPLTTAAFFQEPAADIWQIVRDFNTYPIWIDGCGESLEHGDAVGAIRSVVVQGRHIRQRLLALSDTDRSRCPCP
jgi:hypothetical protein